MDKIVIAKILKPQGIKGELKCKPYADTDLFSSLKEVFLDNEVRRVKSSVYRFGFAYILLEGISSRDEAEKLRGKDIYLDKTDLSDDILVADLENSIILDENSNELGKILSVEQYGSADILNVKLSSGETCSVPYLDTIVLKVHKDEKLVVVNAKKFEEQKVME